MSTHLPPPGSRAVLIGVSTYDDPGLPPLPAAFNSVIAMRDLLTDPDRGAWPPDAVTVITDPDNPGRLASRIRTLASTTGGTFLLYFVGHGLLTATGELCLAVADTNASHPDFTGLSYEWIRNALKPSESPAPTKLVILDCCHSGQAVEALAADDMASRTEIKGAYTLTATTSRHQTAHVPALDQQHTACTTFTAELIRLTETGIPSGGPTLTIGALFPHLRSRLISAGFPTPNQRGTDTAQHHPFTKNRHQAGRTPDAPAANLVSVPQLLVEKRYAEAEAVCKEAIRHAPADAEAYVYLGDALLGQESPEAAMEAYRRAILLEPRHTLVQNKLGNALFTQARYAEAEAAYREDLRLRPHRPIVQCNLGRALQLHGRYASAEAAFREATRLDPEFANAHSYLADTLRRQQLYDEAEAAYLRAISLESDHHDAHNGLGLVYFDRKRYAEAEAAFREAVRLSPLRPVLHNNLGLALKAQKRHAAAEAAFREAIRLDPDYVNAHDNLGDVLRYQGDHPAADAAYREAIRLDPDHFNAHNDLGLNFLKLKRYAEAEAAFREAIRIRESDAVVHDNLGDALYFQQRYAEAETEYREAIRLNPTYARAWKDLGYALRHQGKKKAAQGAFDEAEHLQSKSVAGE